MAKNVEERRRVWSSGFQLVSVLWKNVGLAAFPLAFFFMMILKKGREREKSVHKSSFQKKQKNKKKKSACLCVSGGVGGASAGFYFPSMVWNEMVAPYKQVSKVDRVPWWPSAAGQVAPAPVYSSLASIFSFIFVHFFVVIVIFSSS